VFTLDTSVVADDLGVFPSGRCSISAQVQCVLTIAIAEG
jgi:hypothetical protein